ncbi:hypothetical protein FAEPRAA2165_00951 [Faecalibacterium duncaniae]|uniref:Uncharacterized protein n=1 Tax=Faecalibacterium duncaniae (strain DSM 17677 / JCM 31915 / A2-165) TaxID=411483 RepID=C7H3T9_FAED2|nr:hypothetical protein FAEPRAA2165_00951 [Faecalibacterium duncaniae]
MPPGFDGEGRFCLAKNRAACTKVILIRAHPAKKSKRSVQNRKNTV